MVTNDIIEQLETMRKKKNRYGCMVFLSFIIPMPIMMILGFLGVELAPIIGMVLIFAGVIIFSKIAGKLTIDYKKLYKENFVVSILEEQFDDVFYDYKRGLEESKVNGFGLVSRGNRYRSEDFIKGTYKGIGFEQSEVRITHKKSNDDPESIYFNGRMIAFDLPYKNVKCVQIFTDTFQHRGKPSVNYDMKPVEMESTDFNKRFDVLAADPVDAYYVLTPQFMERIDFLKEKFNHVGMNFQGNKLYVGIWTSGDAFDGDTTRTINLLDEKATIMKDVRVITDIIDVLGMMRDKEENM